MFRSSKEQSFHIQCY